ncbi:MAG: cell division protein FtsA [Campylobacterota bacterium]|nr:cell division protein FtsA [Campylobacterota bacterium]
MNNSILAIDIGTTNIISIVASNDFSNKINILGVGQSKSEGVQKGNIIDIDLASNSIKEAVETALNSSGTTTSKAIVSISGANTKTLMSNGVVNIPSGQITQNDIKQVLKMALYNAQIVADYEVIHVLPLFFRVDDGTTISNPLNMNGSRIEVSANIITAKKTSLTNVRNALKQVNLVVDKFVLSGYANALSILENDQKKHGTAIIDLGGTTTQFVVQKGSAIIYNDFLPIGSENITNDISITFHTPYSAANMIKKQYATLIPYDNNDSDTEQSIKKVKLPLLGNESESKEISLEQIQPILHARIEETLLIINDKLVENAAIEAIDGGIILTGGMTYIPGIKELATKIFGDIPIKISNPKNIQNGYINFDTPTMSTIVGLLLYELDFENGFELDSNSELRQNSTIKIHSKSENKTQINTTNSIDNNTLSDITDIKDIKKIENKKSAFSGILDKLSRWI